MFFVIKYVYHKIGTEHFHIERGKSYGGNGIRRGGAEFIDLGKIIRVKMELLKRAEWITNVRKHLISNYLIKGGQ